MTLVRLSLLAALGDGRDTLAADPVDVVAGSREPVLIQTAKTGG